MSGALAYRETSQTNGEQGSGEAGDRTVALFEALSRKIDQIAEARQDGPSDAALQTFLYRLESAISPKAAPTGAPDDTAFDSLRRSQEALADRLMRMEMDGGDGRSLDAMKTLEAALGRLSDHVAESNRATFQRMDAMEAQVEGRITGMASQNDGLNQRIERMASGVDGIEETVRRLNDRLARSEGATNDAIRGLEESFNRFDTRIDEVARAGSMETARELRTLFDKRADALTSDLARMVTESRSEMALELEGALRTLKGDSIDRAVLDVNQRILATERRHQTTIDEMTRQIAMMAETLDGRMRNLEGRNDDAAASAVREELQKVWDQIEDRLRTVETAQSEGFTRIGAKVGEIADQLDAKLQASEERSADAIGRMGEMVADRLVESERRQSSKLDEALNAMSARVEASEERTAQRLSPLERALQGFGERLGSVEDLSGVPASARRETFVAPPPAPVPAPAAVSAPAPAPATTVEHDPLFSSFDDLPAEPAPAARPTPRVGSVDPLDALLDDSRRELGDIDDAPPSTFGRRDGQARASSMDDAALFGSEDVAAAPLAGWTPDAPPSPASTSQGAEPDYLAAARAAAKGGVGGQIGRGPVAKEKTRKEKPPKTARVDDGERRGVGKAVPLAVAGALVMGVAGAGYVLLNRGEAPVAAKVPPETDGATAALPPIADPLPDPLAETVPAEREVLAETTAQTGEVAAPTEATVPVGATADAAPVPAAPPVPSKAQPTAPPPRAAVSPPPATSRAEARVPVSPPQAAPPAARPTATPTSQPTAARRGMTLEQAASAGEPAATYELGLQRLASGDTNLGVNLIRRSANQGFPAAQYRLAKLHEKGEGVAREVGEARKWTERSAVSGNRKAMHDLGVFYANGEGVAASMPTAAEWFRKAAELGLADSQFNMGELYEKGLGVTANRGEAFYWFRIAARNGDQDAAARAEQISRTLSPEDLARQTRRADAFRPRPLDPRANGTWERPWAGQ
jgi:localization factor PodJL